jgi:general secretion pathway protein I
MIVKKPSCRAGISLLEVLIALAIFLLALIGISQLVTLGTDRAQDVRRQAQAIQLCQAKMAEVAAGAVAVSSSQSNTPFDEDPTWEWSMDSEQGSVAGLWTVTIRVSRPRPDGSRIETSLCQMILDPSLRGAATTAASSSSSSTGSGQSGSSSSSSAGGSMAGSSSRTSQTKPATTGP